MIQTTRLTIRPYTLDDLDALDAFLSDAETLSFWPRPYTREETRGSVERNMKSSAENGFGRWAVVLKESGLVIGLCGIVRMETNGHEVNDLGYIFHRDYWGKGYATEAAQAMLKYGFEVFKLDTITANMPWNHDASRRVAEHIGMTKTGEFNNPRNRGIRTLLYEAHSERSPVPSPLSTDNC